MFARVCVRVFAYFVCVFVWACSVRMSGHVAVHACVCVSSVWVCGVANVGFASFGRTCDVYRGCAVLNLFDRLLN